MTMTVEFLEWRGKFPCMDPCKSEKGCGCFERYREAINSAYDRSDLAICQCWHKAVKEQDLQPGSALEKFVNDVLTSVRSLKDQG